MINVLIVSANPAGLSEVADLLSALPETSRAKIVTAAPEAARALGPDQEFDLLIYRFAAPAQDNSVSERQLLARLILGKAKPPRTIALAFSAQILGLIEHDLAEKVWWIIRSDREGWQERLSEKVRLILQAPPHASETSSYDYDVACVTALRIPELQAVAEIDWNWRGQLTSGDDTEYLVGHVNSSHGRLRVVAAAAPRMGSAATSVLAMKIIQHFRPRYLAAVGIASGLRGQTGLGDILIATEAFDFNAARLRRQKDGDDYFVSDPHGIALDANLQLGFRTLKETRKHLDEIRERWPDRKPDAAAQLHLGPVASGTAVIGSVELLDRIKRQNRQVLALDPDTYALFHAAQNCTPPCPRFFSVKGICDFADLRKNEGFHAYAAFAAAEYFARFVQHELGSVGVSK